MWYNAKSMGLLVGIELTIQLYLMLCSSEDWPTKTAFIDLFEMKDFMFLKTLSEMPELVISYSKRLRRNFSDDVDKSQITKLLLKCQVIMSGMTVEIYGVGQDE